MNKKIAQLFSFFLLSFLSFGTVAMVFAITDGQNATDMIGQFDDNIVAPAPAYDKSHTGNNNPSQYGFRLPEDAVIDAANDRLYVADTYNNRVLVYDLTAGDQLVDRIADNVLGQPNLYTYNTTADQATLSVPTGLALDTVNNMLYVADSGNNRLMVFDVAAITDGENAVNVLGQSNFTNIASGLTQSSLNVPTDLAIDTVNSLLYATDRDNHRVMVFDVTVITDGENAVNVLGQTDFISNGTATSQSGMNTPYGVDYSSVTSTLYVTDQLNNRVLLFDVTAITDGENAVNVLGQADFISSGAAVTAAGMDDPRGVIYDSGNSRLFVADEDSNRVLVFDLTAITDGENAVNVLGQANLTSFGENITQSGLGRIYGVAYDAVNDYLYVLDSWSYRIPIFDVAAITDGENAIDLIGQYDDNLAAPSPIYTKGAGADAPNKIGLEIPLDVQIDTTNNRLYVADQGNQRVLVYNLDASNDLIDRIPDNVLGQSNFYEEITATTQNGLTTPTGFAIDEAGNRLFVSDQGNHRVLVFDTTAITDGENAVNVLGQTDFITSGAGSLTQSTFDDPGQLAYDPTGDLLYVADVNNDRVMVFDVAAITDGENAVNVLGAVDFTTAGGGTGQAIFDNPTALEFDDAGDRLFMADGPNNRVLVFDVAAITDGENAVNVLGQGTFAAGGPNLTQAGLTGPQGLAYDATNNRLFVGDTSSNRVLIFDVTAITDGENAVNVLGQTDFISNGSATSQSGLTFPLQSSYDAGNDVLYVVDAGNSRVLLQNVSTTTTFSGTVFDSVGANIGAGKTVALLKNGTLITTTTTIAGGAYSFSGATTCVAGDIITVFIDDETENGATVTRCNGSSITDLSITEDQLIVRDEDGTSISNANLDTGHNGDADLTALYADGGGTTLTTTAGSTLFVLTTETFTPGGTLDINGDMTLDVGSTFNGAANAVNIAGDLDASLGTWTHTGILTMDGTAAQTFDQGGSAIGSDVVIANTASTVTVTGNAFDIGANDLTINTGAIFVSGGQNVTATGTFSNDGILSLQGGETLNLTIDTDSGTTRYTGNGDTLADTYFLITNGSYYDLDISMIDANDTINALVGLTANDITVNTGTFDLNGVGAVIGGDVTVAGGTLNSSTGASSMTDLTVSGGTLTGGAGALTVTGNFTQSSGTTTAPGAILLSGNWTNSGGTFNHNNATVSIDGTSTITGSNSFYNLNLNHASNDTTNNTYTFDAGAVQTINNNLVVSGLDADDLTLIRSSTPGTYTTFDLQNNSLFGTAGFLDLQDLNVLDNSALFTPIVNPANSTDSGNTNNVFATVVAPGTPDLQAGSDDGTSSTDDQTSLTTGLIFDITCFEGNTVELYVDGALDVSGTCPASGTISLTMAGTLAGSGATYSITAVQQNGAATPSAASTALTVTIGTVSGGGGGGGGGGSSSGGGSSTRNTDVSSATDSGDDLTFVSVTDSEGDSSNSSDDSSSDSTSDGDDSSSSSSSSNSSSSSSSSGGSGSSSGSGSSRDITGGRMASNNWGFDFDVSEIVFNESSYAGTCLNYIPEPMDLSDEELEFTDVESEMWFDTEVEKAVLFGLANGYKDDQGIPQKLFGPNNPIILAEAVAMMIGATEDEVDEVPGSSWYDSYMTLAQHSGLLESLRTFPLYDLQILRQQAVPIFLVATCLDNVEVPTDGISFPDVDEWTLHSEHIYKASALGIINGYADGTFKPQNYTTRAEMTAMILRAVEVRLALIEIEEAQLNGEL